MIANTKDLETLTPNGISKKFKDAEEIYIPWGKETAPHHDQRVDQSNIIFSRETTID